VSLPSPAGLVGLVSEMLVWAIAIEQWKCIKIRTQNQIVEATFPTLLICQRTQQF
jgi:hypothetical protein